MFVAMYNVNLENKSNQENHTFNRALYFWDSMYTMPYYPQQLASRARQNGNTKSYRNGDSYIIIIMFVCLFLSIYKLGNRTLDSEIGH